jgi:hypothetical protein
MQERRKQQPVGDLYPRRYPGFDPKDKADSDAKHVYYFDLLKII